MHIYTVIKEKVQSLKTERVAQIKYLGYLTQCSHV